MSDDYLEARLKLLKSVMAPRHATVWDFNGTLADDQKHLPDWDKTYSTPSQVHTHMPLFPEALKRFVQNHHAGHEQYVLTALEDMHKDAIHQSLNEALKPHGISIPKERIHTLGPRTSPTYAHQNKWSMEALHEHKVNVLSHIGRTHHSVDHICDSDGRPDHRGEPTPDHDLKATHEANKELKLTGREIRQHNAALYRKQARGLPA